MAPGFVTGLFLRQYISLVVVSNLGVCVSVNRFLPMIAQATTKLWIFNRMDVPLGSLLLLFLFVFSAVDNKATLLEFI